MFFFGFHVISVPARSCSGESHQVFSWKKPIIDKTNWKTLLQNMCDYVVETLKLLTISQHELKKEDGLQKPQRIRE